MSEVKLFCLFGPESTGKSVMAPELANAYNTVWVPEVAREIVTSNHFNREDIIEIGRAQTERIFQLKQKANKLLICDTDVITTQIYSRHYLKVVPPILYQMENMVRYDHYFLFDIDVPWVADGMRDLSEQRETMFNIFKEALEQRKMTYTLVRGNWEQRLAIVKQKIDEYMHAAQPYLLK
jgi:HTH-type transcriptional regulator, transcriptional repressor of NAD biosynthesis genes